MLMMGRGPVGSPIQYPKPVIPVKPVGPPQAPGFPGGFGGQHPIGGPMPAPVIGQFHKGGKVPKTANYRLKKGEHVIPVGKRKMTNRGPQKLMSVSALKA